jgi:2-aminoadipate transaminase
MEEAAMLQIALRRESDVPLYRQVTEQIAGLIRRGALANGARLPTIRQLAEELGLTRLTVHSAYAELQAQGLIESTVGRGTFVAARPPAPARHSDAAEAPVQWRAHSVLADLVALADRPDLISLAQAMPAPETLPVRAFGKALRQALEAPGSLGYGSIQGDVGLREQVRRVALERGVAAHPDEVLITAGAQQGIDLALAAFAAPGEVVLVEEPTYPGALEVAARRGQRLVGVPMDADGMDIAALEAACAEHRPRLLYTVAAFHNPTGVSLSAERRQALLRVARAHNLLIVEDDVYGLLCYDAPAPPALKAEDADGRVIYCTSFSKALMPALRLGAIMATPDQLAELAGVKHSSDLVCSPLMQRALAEYLREGRLDAHLQHARGLYHGRRDATLEALARYMPGCAWTQPAGGLNVWVTLPEGVGERDFCLDAIAQGVGVAPGRAFYGQLRSESHIRVSFGAHPPERIRQAIATLGKLLDEHLRRRTLLLARASREAGPLV